MRILIVSCVLLMTACAHMPNPNDPPNYRKIYGLTLDKLPNMTWEEVKLFYANAIDLPMVRLLANPEEYDGKAVSTCGVYSNEFEGTALYLNRESYEYGFNKNLILILTNYTEEALLDEMEGHYVCLIGVYEAKVDGRYSGHLYDVAPMTRANIKLPNRRASSDPYPESENRKQIRKPGT